MKKTIAYFSLLLWLATACADEYKMTDLQALAAQQHWLALWTHLDDILPSARTAAWQQLLQQAAQGQMKRLKETATPHKALFFAQQALARYPELQANTVFMTQAAKIAWSSFDRCFQQPRWLEDCQRDFLGFAKQYSDHGKLAFRGGKQVRQKRRSELAIPFFYAALAQQQDAPDCADEDVWLAIDAALTLSDPSREEIALAQTLAFGACWQAVQEKLIHSVTSSALRRTRTCPQLLQKKALRGLRLKKCKRMVAEQ